MNTENISDEKHATMADVKEEKIRTIVRNYFKRRVEEHGTKRGYVKAFERATGIKHAQTSLALRGEGEVSWGMLAKISETIGPAMDAILSELAGMVAHQQSEDIKRAAAEKAGDDYQRIEPVTDEERPTMTPRERLKASGKLPAVGVRSKKRQQSEQSEHPQRPASPHPAKRDPKD